MRTVSLVISLLFASISYGHDYFFAFAEVEFNDITQTFEGTLMVSTHDLERSANELSYNLGNLNEIKPDSPEFNELEELLSEHFSIKCGSDICEFNLVGHEVLLNGITNFYFESNKIDISQNIEIKFDILMDQFEAQQNKITFYHRGHGYTRAFLNNERTQQIKLENE